LRRRRWLGCRPRGGADGGDAAATAAAERRPQS